METKGGEAKGMIFNPLMVVPMKARYKFVTRRSLAQPNESVGETIEKDPDSPSGYSYVIPGVTPTVPVPVRYKVGDLVYVKENFYAFGKWQKVISDGSKFFYNYPHYEFLYTDNPPEKIAKGKTGGWHLRPSIFMPARAARIFFRITEMRIERLFDITEEDAILEGIEPATDHLKGLYLDYTGNKTYASGGLSLARSVWVQPVSSYQSLWEFLHGKGSWKNDYILRYRFEFVDVS